jgi:hypothetical protein
MEQQETHPKCWQLRYRVEALPETRLLERDSEQRDWLEEGFLLELPRLHQEKIGHVAQILSIEKDMSIQSWQRRRHRPNPVLRPGNTSRNAY